jgi:hypothetical protein
MNAPSRLQGALVFLCVFLFQYLIVRSFALDDLAPLLQHHWQLIDIVALEKAPFSSLLYIHTQPPLFNFIVGLLAQLPFNLYHSLVVLNCLSGAVIALILYLIAGHLTQSRMVGFVIAMLYAIAPSTLLYAGYPFYPTLTSLGYALYVYSLFIAHSSFRKSVIFLVLSIVYLTLLRSSMSLPHALLFVGIYLFYTRARKLSYKTMGLLLFCSLSPLLALQAKNLALYDFFGSTSWAPLNLIKGAGIAIHPNHFPAPEQLLALYPNTTCDHHYVDIDTDLKKSTGAPNYNSCYFLSFAQGHRATLFTHYRLMPHIYRMISHLGQYLALPDTYIYLSNRKKIESYTNFYNLAFLTVVPRVNYEIRLSLVFLCMLTLIFSIKHKDIFVLNLFAIFVIHMASYVLTDGDEGKRFVFEIEFMFYIFTAYLMSFVQRKYRRKFIKNLDGLHTNRSAKQPRKAASQ